MKLAAGDLDKEITFQKRSQTKDPRTGTVIKGGGWTNYVTVRAQMQDVLPSRSERVAETLNIARRPVRVRIYYRDDIDSDMRILYGSRVLHIVAGPAELGRRDGLELMAEEYTSGDQTA